MKTTCCAVGATCLVFGAIAASPQQGAVAVKTAKPEAVAESEPYVVVARTDGSHEVKLTARVVGTLWERKGEEGEAVKKGDVLYRIEDTIYKAYLKTAKAKAAELEAKLKLAELEAARYTKTETSGGVSKSERDRVVLARDVARAELEAAEAQVTLCENDLSYCTITSPIDGFLGRYKFDVGNNVCPQVGELRDVIQADPIDVRVSEIFGALQGQLGVLMLIGITAKSAILIAEYAMQKEAEGVPLVEAAIEGMKQRFRSVQMTGLSFVIGVLPLLFATGPGANARHAVGVATFYGMLTACVVGMLFVPPLYVFFRRLAGVKG